MKLLAWILLYSSKEHWFVLAGKFGWQLKSHFLLSLAKLLGVCLVHVLPRDLGNIHRLGLSLSGSLLSFPYFPATVVTPKLFSLSACQRDWIFYGCLALTRAYTQSVVSHENRKLTSCHFLLQSSLTPPLESASFWPLSGAFK